MFISWAPIYFDMWGHHNKVVFGKFDFFFFHIATTDASTAPLPFLRTTLRFLTCLSISFPFLYFRGPRFSIVSSNVFRSYSRGSVGSNLRCPIWAIFYLFSSHIASKLSKHAIHSIYPYAILLNKQPRIGMLMIVVTSVPMIMICSFLLVLNTHHTLFPQL